MRLLASLLAACAFTASLLTGRSTADHVEKGVNGTECKTPIIETVPGCAASVIRFYYDEEYNTCKSFIWNGCLLKGIFNLLHDCVSTCNPGQSVPFCAGGPANECSKTSGESAMTMMKRKAYFYNATSRTCEEYDTCAMAPANENGNHFPTKTNCELQCGGFSAAEMQAIVAS
uniref:Putative bpti/kunitz family of serine protease inhibitor n=1 Tax=Amblyomma tuberculatum TaxID=48802 RepID=A0A6M2E793_9ACAR